MPRKLIDLTGKRFGMLTVDSLYMKQMFGGKERWFWRVNCDCGRFNFVPSASLTRGKTKSCGCMQYVKHH